MKARSSFLVSAAASISLRLSLIRAMSSKALHPPSARTTTAGSSAVSKPTLHGVVFDMDGTLTKPNLDFAEMYRRCGVDPAHDILEQIAQLPSAEEQEQKLAIIEEMEEEGRRTLELMPGAMELISWLDSHEISMAIVTRNTRRTTDVLVRDILPPSLGKHFHPMITRDDEYPPKPDPAAMQAIMKEWAANDQHAPESSSFLMVGDSVANDIGFGNQAGATTALLDSGRRYQEEQQGKTASIDDTILKPDLVVDCLWQLSRKIWFHFNIDGKLGTTQQSLPNVPAPKGPETELGIAATNGDLFLVRAILEKDGADVNGIDESGNTALIWATERNQAQMVQLLVGTENINLNHRGFLRATALCRASRRGYDDVLKILLQAGADPNIPNEKLQCPLHFAAFQKHKVTVQLLLNHGANPLVLDRKGRTPAQDTSDEAIRRLLQEAEKQSNVTTPRRRLSPHRRQQEESIGT